MKKKYLVWLDLPGYNYFGMSKSILISKHYFKTCAIVDKYVSGYWLNKLSKNKDINYLSLIKITKK